MDPRLIRRRRQVREDSARSSLRRLLVVLAVLGLVGSAVWLIQSPLLQVGRLVVRGAGAERVAPILAQQGVVLGRPLLLVRPGRVEAALARDPWIARVTVSLVLPDTVEIDVVEREPGAWLVGPRPTLLATDGVVLGEEGGPAADDDLLELEVPAVQAGRQHEDRRVLGALAFLTALGPDREEPVTVFERTGELWARLQDVEVRLGRPTAMEAKAAALLALLDRGVPSGSTIVLLAPTRPALIPPPESE